MTDTNTTRLSDATTTLLEIADAASSVRDTEAPLLALAGHLQVLAALSPTFHRAVRNARSSVESRETLEGKLGDILYTQGATELLDLTDAALALTEAHARTLDALCAASDFLEGEGLPGMPI